jgi:hypothetical protein
MNASTLQQIPERRTLADATSIIGPPAVTMFDTPGLPHHFSPMSAECIAASSAAAAEEVAPAGRDLERGWSAGPSPERSVSFGSPSFRGFAAKETPRCKLCLLCVLKCLRACQESSFRTALCLAE